MLQAGPPNGRAGQREFILPIQARRCVGLTALPRRAPDSRRNALVRSGFGLHIFRASQPRKLSSTSRKRNRRRDASCAKTARRQVRRLARRPPPFVERRSARRRVAGPHKAYANERHNPQAPPICRLGGSLPRHRARYPHARAPASLRWPRRRPSRPRRCRVPERGKQASTATPRDGKWQPTAPPSPPARARR